MVHVTMWSGEAGREPCYHRCARALGEWDAAHRRLDEAYGLATRGGNPQNGWQGGMQLHLADTLLHRAGLFRSRDEYPWPGRTPEADLDDAETLIDACGYHSLLTLN